MIACSSVRFRIRVSKFRCKLFNAQVLLNCVLTLSSHASDYMAEKLGIEQRKIPDLSNLLYKSYGTTMAGLLVRRVAPFILL
ncbi:hypothetical protein B296_00024205 [Ensete ventricosum]|uniref:Uncharacterized protein n=1 Tax=Ensete ventricosum TaxID=4639 RepID=A0A427ARH9_ENSVE|nr:hypothetical protein B296_00024205 [Ensete ventricosum]